jgi:glutamine amidotransferase
MKKRIAIIDYGMSNMFSMKNALDRLGFDSCITTDVEALDNADGAVLPGVGSFPEAVNKLRSLGFDKAIPAYLASGRPFLGVCLGFQLLFESSKEFVVTPGLGILKGDVAALADSLPDQRIPHIGWKIAHARTVNAGTTLLDPLRGIGNNSYFYFVHSYYAQPVNSQDIYTLTRYGDLEFCSSVLKDNIFACQFHPEKSGEAGIQLLTNLFTI